MPLHTAPKAWLLWFLQHRLLLGFSFCLKNASQMTAADRITVMLLVLLACKARCSTVTPATNCL